jgi:hypothetical protein
MSKEANMKLRMMLTMGLAVFSLALVKTPPKGNAYGYYCRGESKKHVKGEKGTAFSRCVRAHKRAANQPDLTPKQACKDLKKQKHVAHGDKGTPFSRCVKSVAQQRKDEAATVTTSAVA